MEGFIRGQYSERPGWKPVRITRDTGEQSGETTDANQAVKSLIDFNQVNEWKNSTSILIVYLTIKLRVFKSENNNHIYTKKLK